MADKSHSAFFNRVGHVEILADNVTRKFYDLDFKFNIRKNCLGAIQDLAKVGILGLNRDTTTWLSTYLSIADERAKRRYIKVYGGYESSGEQLLFAGEIIRAKPSQPVDNWMNIDAQTGAWLRGEILSVHASSGVKKDSKEKPRPLTVKKLMQNISKGMGKPLVYMIDENDPDLETVMSSFDAMGTWLDIVKRFNYQTGVKILIGPEHLIVCHADTTKISGTRIFDISEETGMIGVPDYQWPIVRFRCLLNPAMKIFDYAMIKSKLVPHAYGKCQITDMTYVGHLRGTEWYTECEARMDPEVIKVEGK